MIVKAKKKILEISVLLTAEEAQYILDDLNNCEHRLYNDTEDFRKALVDALKGSEEE